MHLDETNTMQNIGYLVAASIGFKRVKIMNTSAYMVLFASGWAWPATILVAVWFIPESPYYLVRKGDMEKARRMLQRLSKKDADVSPTLESIVVTNEEEKQHAVLAADVSFLECFKGTNWRRTRIILYANGLSQMIGASFNANGPYFLVSAGMSPSNVAMMIEIGIAFGIVSSVVTFFCIRVYPRRSIILFGLFLALALMIMMGVAGCFPHRSAALW
jgi:SP family general alpha glucoside:H+ symporter-like MFS transporter